MGKRRGVGREGEIMEKKKVMETRVPESGGRMCVVKCWASGATRSGEARKTIKLR